MVDDPFHEHTNCGNPPVWAPAKLAVTYRTRKFLAPMALFSGGLLRFVSMQACTVGCGQRAGGHTGHAGRQQALHSTIAASIELTS